MGRMKDLYIDFLNAQEEDPQDLARGAAIQDLRQDSPLTREEWEQEKNRREECHKPKKEEDNGN